MLSLAESAASLFWLVYAIWCTSTEGAAASNLLGGVGVCAFFLQLAALVTGVRALREENVFRGIPKTSIAVAVLGLLLWTAMYGLGVSMLLL